MPTLHRVQFAGGAEVVLRMRDLSVPAIIGVDELGALGELLAFRLPPGGVWQLAPITARRQLTAGSPRFVAPPLTGAGATAMAAVAVAAAGVPEAIFYRLVPEFAPPPP